MALMRTVAATMMVAGASALYGQAPMVDLTPSPAVIAITGGKLLTITHGAIENGTLLMQSGKILAVGSADSVKVPAGATIVDAKGMTVYPGLIDAETNLGLVEVQSDQVNSDLVETSDEIFPNMHVADAFHAETERIPIVRYNGITNAIVAPESRDTMPGQDIFIQLAGKDRDAMILNRDIALAINVGDEQKRGGRGGLGSAYPSTRMGEFAQLQQALIDAQEYMAKKSAPKPEKGEKTKFDLKAEALIPYLKGERPVVLGAVESRDVENAVAMAQQFHLKIILNHVTRTQDILDKIAAYHVPVIVGPIYDAPGPNERYDAVFSLPGELQKRGVKIAFASYGVGFNRNLPYAAGYAVAYGLPYDEALKAITLNPAEMFGVADKLGSLDVGKVANVVIANGDPLDVRTSVQQVYIQGVAIPMVTRQTRLRDAYMPLTKQ